MVEADDYLDKLQNAAQMFINDSLVQKRLEFIEQTVAELNGQQIPSQNFFSLVFSEAEILQIIGNSTNSDFAVSLRRLEELDSLLSYFRQYLQEHYGYWATITKPFINSLVQEFPNESYLELMAGNGYLSQALRELDKKVYATDSLTWSQTSETGKKTVTEVEKLDALAAFDKYINQVDILVIAWSPDFDEIDYQILQKYRKIKESKPLFFIIGEKNGATNSKKFWNEAQIVPNTKVDHINENYQQYDIVADKLYLID